MNDETTKPTPELNAQGDPAAQVLADDAPDGGKVPDETPMGEKLDGHGDEVETGAGDA